MTTTVIYISVAIIFFVIGFIAIVYIKFSEINSNIKLLSNEYSNIGSKIFNLEEKIKQLALRKPEYIEPDMNDLIGAISEEVHSGIDDKMDDKIVDVISEYVKEINMLKNDIKSLKESHNSSMSFNDNSFGKNYSNNSSDFISDNAKIMSFKRDGLSSDEISKELRMPKSLVDMVLSQNSND